MCSKNCPSVDSSPTQSSRRPSGNAVARGPTRPNPAQRFICGVGADRTLTDKEYTEQHAKMGDMAVPYQTSAGFGRFLQAQDERYRALATVLKLE